MDDTPTHGLGPPSVAKPRGVFPRPLMTSLDDLVDAVKRGCRDCSGSGRMPRVAVARSADDHVLEAGVHAYERGVAEPVFIGEEDLTRAKAKALGLDISGLAVIHAPDDKQAMRQALRLFKSGGAQLIMKGRIDTSSLMRAMLDKEEGVPPDGILSHVAVFQPPGQNRLMLMSDAGVNIKPTMERKAQIIRNALAVARALGMARPKVAIIAATEKVNYPAMPATLDASLLSKLAEQGEFGECDMAGPLSLDIAASPEAAACKGVEHPVAGGADVLIMPAIESGNVLYKSLSTFVKVHLAGVVTGSRAPIVVPSRSDSDKSKFYSLALAAYLAQLTQEGL